MRTQRTNHTITREKALAEGVKDVAAELRLIDVVDFIAFIRTEQFGNLASLVNSSTEMYFKPGALCFGLSGDVALTWGGAPIVMLDMEFRHQGVNVYFRLVLEALTAGVEINYITFDGAAQEPEINTQRLIEAIADARLAPPAEARPAVEAA